MKLFSEIVKNSPTNRNNIIELPEGKSNIDIDWYGKEVYDGFHSAFIHTNKFKQHVDQTGSVKGYNGDVFSDCFYWDIDSEDLEQAKNDTIEICNRLFSYNKENIAVYFSGNKGFHILYMSPEVSKLDIPNINEIVRSFCVRIAGDIPTFDLKIYDKTRIIRTPNSKHPATNLYKIPLTVDELCNLTVPEIKELATKQRRIDFKPDWNKLYSKVDAMLGDIIRGDKEEQNHRGSSGNIIEGITHGFKSGERNTGLCSVAGLLHSRNFNDDIIRAFLHSINRNSDAPLSDSDVDTIVHSISRYPVKEEYKEADENKIKTFKDAGFAWRKLISESGTFSFGPRYPHINEVMDVTLLGDLIGIVASSGVGKSTLLMDMMNEYATIKDCNALMLSLEMADHACFFRGAQIVYQSDGDGNVNSKELAYKLIHDQETFDRVVDAWNRIAIVDETMSINQIEDWICTAREKMPSINMVGIDYLQFIQNMTDITESMKIARELKGIMKRNKIFGIDAIQTNKSIMNSFAEVQDNHIEGAQAIKQAHDYLMYFWHSNEDKRRIHGKFGKTRWSSGGKTFDLYREGLCYHSEDYTFEKRGDGGL